MTRPVPAATATLRVLRFLSGQPVPVPASRVADAIGLPRSSTYHLLAAMTEEDFVVHYPEDRTWGLGIGAWEVGVAFAQQEPLARLARVPLARLVDTLRHSAHLAVLHGTDVLYVLEERAPGRPSLVTDVGVRLPAHLTASGRAILATLPRPQVRALYPDASAFVSRTDVGPRTPTQLRDLLGETRRRGHATEDGEVTPGFRSVAVALTAPSVRAAVAVTWESSTDVSGSAVVEAVRTTAATLDRRLHAR
ncbi:IclR family transcriptional regulator [Mumia zhuanghuii]|uniref:IclR family transcriptional regulator n=1 Tax=Mumia zhuanghuii TaxID=2585211 RepID=A0A5C4MJZ5_9ACTN|nr:IclR family transcriptional regulator [Mumia zhuanghuii]TNC42928.1 IclR family transcriptional regulator [Mumia zhuanghuii]TNC50660.1 IclR family transcriptional regulator [Mumia zhuanghuii]